MTPQFRLVCSAVGVLVLSGVSLAQPPASRGTEPQPPTPPAGQTQAQPPEPQQPVFRAGINFVRVDVIVTDGKGAPVLDLKESDFEITEDGKPQSVESFKLVRVSSASEVGAQPPREIRTAYDEESEAQRDDVRLIAIYLDDYHVRRSASMGVREPLIRFIQMQLAASDMIGVAYPLTPVSEIQLTRNHGAIASAVDHFEGRKFEYQPRNQFEEQYAHYPSDTVERIRNQVSLSGLKALVTHLGGLREGRKTVIVVSEGFTDMLPPQMRDADAQMPGYGNPNRMNPAAGQNDPREDTARFFANMDLQDEMREVYNAANRSNTALYTLDPRGLAAFEFDINERVGMTTDSSYLRSTQDTLRTLAENTDGRAIVNRNDLDGGLKQVMTDLSGYYLVGYNSTQAPADGKFHAIRVRVKRPGVQVRARKGYWALSAEETARALEPPKPGPAPEVGEALGQIARQARQRTVRTWIGTARGESGKTKVTFVWEAAPAQPGVKREDPARVSLTATNEEGAPYFRGRVPDASLASTSSSAVGAATAGSPASAPSRVVFDAVPGRIQMKMSVEGPQGQVLDTEVQEIVIPDFTTPQVRIGTPAVLRARTALEFRNLAQDAQAMPVAGREFRRTDRLVVRFSTYGPGSTPPTATVRLLNRAGQPMSDLPVTAGPGGGSQIDLPLSSLAAGEYLLEIQATGPEGQAKELLGIKITS